jgi:hypothetical protein
MNQTPLPPVADTSHRTIEIYAHEKRPRELLDETKRVDIPKITFAEDGPLTHPTAMRIEKCISRSKKDDRGLLLARQGVAVPIRVSAERLPRALRICDALLQALEQTGYLLTWETPYNEPLKVTVLDEPLTFLISEKVKRSDHPANDNEPWWQRQRWDYEPTGRLMLTIECDESLGIRHTWSDGKKNVVEDALGHFIASLPLAPKALKQKREEQAVWHRQWEEERKREVEQAARRAEYERRAKVVEELARSWDQSKSLRGFAEKLSSQAEQSDIPEDQRKEIRGMAEWAMRHAAFVDPFTDPERMILRFKTPPWGYGS